MTGHGNRLAEQNITKTFVELFILPKNYDEDELNNDGGKKSDSLWEDIIIKMNTEPICSGFTNKDVPLCCLGKYAYR